MRPDVTLRPFTPADTKAVDALVCAAYAEFEPLIPGWAEFSRSFTQLTALANLSEVLVAEREGRLVGAVGYVGAGQPKRDFFHPSWPVVRFLSVLPSAQGMGLGRVLVQACIDRALRDRAPLLALHTSTVMVNARRLYQRMGFEEVADLPPMAGVPYVMMHKHLA
jgi:GNAT superfamily N-acetyltransferase